MKNIIPLILFYFLFSSTMRSQNCNALNLVHQSDIPSTCNQMTLTMIKDNQGFQYLYVANKEGGLKIYSIANINSPVLLSSISTLQFDTLDVMNIDQKGNYLYLALGNHFTNPQKAGMAIVDISNIMAPVVSDYYIVNGSTSGAGIVKVEGNYAYLGAMQSGLIILNISNPTSIQFVSQFFPNINYPVNNPNANFYNARGMEVKNGIVYLCFDAGGLRIIDCNNPNSPNQIGQYANPALYIPFNLPRAYNNIVLDGNLAYIAVDYCGMEVLNISNPSSITLHGWWNPYNCPGNNWYTSPSHANEIALDKNCQTIFLSTGKSDLMVLDVSNPANPDSCNYFGGVSNGIGTWGIALGSGEIFLSYICTLGIPFVSGWTGVKNISYSTCSSNINSINKGRDRIYPNPFENKFKIKCSYTPEKYRINIFDLKGSPVEFTSVIDGNEIEVQISNITSGTYLVELISNEEIKRLIVQQN